MKHHNIHTSSGSLHGPRDVKAPRVRALQVASERLRRSLRRLHLEAAGGEAVRGMRWGGSMHGFIWKNLRLIWDWIVYMENKTHFLWCLEVFGGSTIKVPYNGLSSWKKLLTWMIWGYPHFRKPQGSGFIGEARRNGQHKLMVYSTHK